MSIWNRNRDDGTRGIRPIQPTKSFPPPPPTWVPVTVSAYNLKWTHLKQWLVEQFPQDSTMFDQPQSMHEDAYFFFAPREFTDNDTTAIDALRKRSSHDQARQKSQRAKTPDPLPRQTIGSAPF